MERTTLPPSWWRGPADSWEPIAGIHQRLQTTRREAGRRLRRVSLLGGTTFVGLSATPIFMTVLQDTCGWPPPELAIEALIVAGVGLAVVWVEGLIDAWTRMAGDESDLSELWVHLTRAAARGWIHNPDSSGASHDERVLAADAQVAASAQSLDPGNVRVSLWGYPRFQVEA